MQVALFFKHLEFPKLILSRSLFLMQINPITVVGMDLRKGLKIINFLTIYFACKKYGLLSYILSLSVYSFLEFLFIKYYLNLEF